MKRVHLIPALVVLTLLSACAAPQTDRSGKLLALAGEETMQISSLKERLTRQLNIAETQIQRDEPTNAVETMKGAIETLDKLDKDLDDHTRLAGLVSISELSRAAHNPVFARGAIDRALKAVHAIEPASARCQYVLGIAFEVEHVSGKAEAGSFLIEAGQWAQEIKDQDIRRQALSAYAWRLFEFDNFDAGKDMLRHESDVAWRADTLVAMSKLSRSWEQSSPDGFFSGSSSPQGPPAFGSNLDYGSNFQGQQLLKQSVEPQK